MRAIDAALTQVESTPGDLALVITAQGKFFSNGLVLDLFVEQEYSAAFQSLVVRLLVLEVPTVCAINGHCYGGGLPLALAGDELCARSERGFLCLPETSIRVPFTAGLTALVTARLTPRDAHRAMVLSERYDAPAAAAGGIVDDAVPGPDLLAHAVRRAGELSPLCGPVLATNKRRRYADVAEALHRPEQLTVQSKA